MPHCNSEVDEDKTKYSRLYTGLKLESLIHPYTVVQPETCHIAPTSNNLVSAQPNLRTIQSRSSTQNQNVVFKWHLR